MNEYAPFFYGPQADYYTAVAEDLGEGKTRFNEGAFFFGMFWMAYRKMYVNAAITFALIMAESALEDWLIPELSETKAYILTSNLVIASVIGFIGNRLYINFARKRVAELVPASATLTGEFDPDVVSLLRKEGGTSWAGPLVMVLAFIALVGFVFYLTM